MGTLYYIPLLPREIHDVLFYLRMLSLNLGHHHTYGRACVGILMRNFTTGTILSTETISGFFTGDQKPESPAYPGRHAGPGHVYPAGS